MRPILAAAAAALAPLLPAAPAAAHVTLDPPQAQRAPPCAPPSACRTAAPAARRPSGWS